MFEVGQVADHLGQVGIKIRQVITPRKKWVDFGLKLLRATTTHSDGPQRLKMTALA